MDELIILFCLKMRKINEKQILKRKHNPESFNRETVLLGAYETLQN